jgi:hypothetical protein
MTSESPEQELEQEQATPTQSVLVILPVDAQVSEGHTTPYQGIVTRRSALANPIPPFAVGSGHQTTQPTEPDNDEEAAFLREVSARLRVALTSLRRGQETAAQKFERLLNDWRLHTAHQSMLWKKIGDPNYHRIMAMGERALPFIMSELRRDGAYWFPALEAITEDDPTIRLRTEEEAVDAWLNWGRVHGYL